MRTQAFVMREISDRSNAVTETIEKEDTWKG